MVYKSRKKYGDWGQLQCPLQFSILPVGLLLLPLPCHSVLGSETVPSRSMFLSVSATFASQAANLKHCLLGFVSYFQCIPSEAAWKCSATPLSALAFQDSHVADDLTVCCVNV